MPLIVNTIFTYIISIITINSIKLFEACITGNTLWQISMKSNLFLHSIQVNDTYLLKFFGFSSFLVLNQYHIGKKSWLNLPKWPNGSLNNKISKMYQLDFSDTEQCAPSHFNSSHGIKLHMWNHNSMRWNMIQLTCNSNSSTWNSNSSYGF